MMQKTLITILLLTCSCAYAAQASANAALANKPPMGWNSWNHFSTKVTDEVIRKQADAMVSSGMRDAGYEYINIDDAWEGTRDAQGFIHSNSKFPNMKALADYVHSKGLKLGIYSSPGPKTCAGYEGSYQHESQDAQTFADWGIDYIKYDLCTFREIMKKAGTPQKAHELMVNAYTVMHNALLVTGRPIVFSMCQYGFDAVWRWGATTGGNLWRTTADVKDNYERMASIGFSQAGLSPFAGPGHWNDPDMLEIGNGGMTTDEYRTHMTLWAMLSAPLIAGNDLTTMSQETLDILTNKEIIAIDQDALGIQGDRVSAEGPIEIWSKPLNNRAKAVALFNRNEYPLEITVDFKTMGFNGKVKARDLWLHKDLGILERKYTATVTGHGVVLLRVTASN